MRGALGLILGNKVGEVPSKVRDLLGIAMDHAAYLGQPRHVTREHMDWAWKNYFVSLKPGEHAQHATALDGGR